MDKFFEKYSIKLLQYILLSKVNLTWKPKRRFPTFMDVIPGKPIGLD